MQIGMIGLGRMGANMVRRLLRGGHTCVVYDRDPAPVKELVGEGAKGTASLDEMVAALTAPRTIWMMLPAGEITETTIQTLAGKLASGDVLIDGGNSYFKDDIRRSTELSAKGIHYLDAGTSGGIWGLERGYCLMVGGDKETVTRLDPIWKTLAPGESGIAPTAGRTAGTAEEGYLHCGPSGAGHFVKMVHNGIEYGLMQAYAEGFDIMRNADCQGPAGDHRYDLDLGEIAELWRRGSVVSSWLLDLSAMALAGKPRPLGITPASSRTRARAAGRSSRRSRKRCRPTCSPPRSTPASARARSTPSPRRSSPRCATGSAATSSGRREGRSWPRQKAAVPADSRRRRRAGTADPPSW